MRSSTSLITPIQDINQALPCPCHLHLSTGRYPVIHTSSCSRCPIHFNLPCLTTSNPLYTQETTNPYCISYPSATPRKSISPSSVQSSPDFADLLSSSLRFQSHMSIQRQLLPSHSTEIPCCPSKGVPSECLRLGS